MEIFEEYLQKMKKESHRSQMRAVLAWVIDTFPTLTPKIAWNQPMFTDHGTFIIGFSAAKEHFAVSPELQGMTVFSHDITQSGYSQTPHLFRIKWDQPVNFPLLEGIIRYNLADKKNCTTFWRK